MSYPLWKNNCAIYTLIRDQIKRNNIDTRDVDLALEIFNDINTFFNQEKEGKSDKYYCGTCDLTFSEKNKKRHNTHSKTLSNNLLNNFL